MRDFVDKHAPDLFLIQETHLRPEDSFKIPNYRCYRNDRTHPAPGRGGTAVLIKNCIPHYHVPTPPQFTGVEATLLMLTPKDHEPIFIGSTYIPPINDYFRNLGAALDTIFNITNMTILVGDFNAKHTSWGCPVNDARGNRLYRYVVNSGIDANSTPEIESQVNDLTSEILTAHGNASKPMIHREPPFVQGELKQLFRERNRARKLWQFTRFPLHKTELNRIQNKIKRKVGLYRQQLWEEHLTSLDAEDGSLWGTARAFRKKATPISALNGPNGVALSDTNKTDLIAKSLESQFQLNNIQNPQKIISFPILSKHTLLIILTIILTLSRLLFLRKYFPNAWKTAVVIPILKPGKIPNLRNPIDRYLYYRFLANWQRKLLLPDLMITWKTKILVPEQHGFRPRLSTTHQLLRVVEYIKDGIDRHQYTAAVFLDIQKAFDRVWHTGLLFKLIMYKIPPPLILLLKSYISDRSFTVKINRTFSQVRPAKAGVAQGSILGPVLFNLYVNDILKTTNTMICMYADDTAILSRHYNPNTLTQNINEHLAHLEIWFSVWKIALNTTKTEAVFFTQRRPPPEITLQNQRIPWSQHTKYLGVIIDKNLTFRQHITYVRNKFKNATRQIYSLICKKSKLNRHNKMLIYTLILKPLLTYASPIWAHAARTNINLIEISQNVILRQILDAHWYMRNADIRSALNIPTIRQTIRKLAINFFSNIDGHENPSIQEIPTYPTYPFIRRPRDILVDPDFN
ncbi:RNA-directed DNA polymerase from mobile element jockey [Trichonephila clavipes]|nr:RNA-directed DNA polymerase from mobile element jockey [Trichonephila clavipes]